MEVGGGTNAPHTRRAAPHHHHPTAHTEADVDRQRTRDLLREMLGPITLIRDAEGVTWAQMTKPAEHLLAVSGLAYSDGCGGAQNAPEAQPRLIRICG